MNNGFPATIFQTWKSKTDIPPRMAYWSQTMRDMNPAHEYVLWDDADNRAFIAEHFPWFLDRYDSYPAEIFRADAVRYFYLYRNGGIYADMDVECLRPLSALDDLPYDVVLGRMGSDLDFEHSIPNVVMVSRPGAEFWRLMMSLLLDPPSVSSPRPEYNTGPVMLKICHDFYTQRYLDIQGRLAHITSLLGETRGFVSKIAVMPGRVFYPVDWSDPIHEHHFRLPLKQTGKPLERDAALRLFPSSLTTTYWEHSWE